MFVFCNLKKNRGQNNSENLSVVYHIIKFPNFITYVGISVDHMFYKLTIYPQHYVIKINQ